MIQSGPSEYNNIGGLGAGYGSPYGGGLGFGGGMGSFGMFGLFGLLNNRNGGGIFGGGDDTGRDLATLAAIEALKDKNCAEFRDVANNICDVKSKVQDAAYASALQAHQNTESIKSQAVAFHIDMDRKIDALEKSGDRNTAAILARINQSEVDSLRDQLWQERDGRRSRETEISITNSATAVSQQVQSQIQSQISPLYSALNILGDQVNRSTNSIVSVGSKLYGNDLNSSPTNIR